MICERASLFECEEVVHHLLLAACFACFLGWRLAALASWLFGASCQLLAGFAGWLAVWQLVGALVGVVAGALLDFDC
jgi:hypothetical protein